MLRPVLVGAAVALLGAGWWLGRRKQACASDACAPSGRSRGFLAGGLVAVAVTAGWPFLYGAAPVAAYARPDGAQTHTYSIGGMSCADCAAPLQSKVRAVDGVLAAAVQFEAKTLEVAVTDPKVLVAVREAVASSGFEVLE